MHKVKFGVFNAGKLVFQIGLSVECTLYQAELVVCLLDMAKYTLNEGDYFAYDFC